MIKVGDKVVSKTHPELGELNVRFVEPSEGVAPGCALSLRSSGPTVWTTRIWMI